MMKWNLGEGHLVRETYAYTHTHTHTHTFFKKSTVTLVQIKLEDRGFSHLVTLPVGPLWVAGGHREDPLPSPEWVLKWYMW